MKPHSLSLLCCLLLLACDSGADNKPSSVVYSFTLSDELISNPERGFFNSLFLPGAPDFKEVRRHGNTLVHLNIRLDSWRNRDIPANTLHQFQRHFDHVRQHGLKSIIRFSYNQGPYPNAQPDASKTQILAHITQLTPLLKNNQDVIAWAEAGFMGAWGEWHTSTHQLENMADKQAILQAFRRVLPSSRFIQLRYPEDLIAMYPQPELAYQQKIAHHNDCFLAADDDNGTYNRHDKSTYTRDVAYLSVLNQRAPMSGETCAINLPRSNCANSLQELNQLGFSSINEDYHEGVIQGWKKEGCYQNINKQLGYRLALLSAEIIGDVAAGANVTFKATLQNSGFAPVINERPVYLVIHNAAHTHKIKLNADPRHWKNGTHSITESLVIPASLAQGTYQLSLWLPDSAASLQNNPLYAIRLSNRNIWDSRTGYNLLGNISTR